MKEYILKLSRQRVPFEAIKANDLNELIEKAKFIKTLSRYSFKSIELTVECDREILFSIDYKQPTRTIEQPTRTIEDVLKEVTERYGITPDDLFNKSRMHSMSNIRAEFYHLCIESGIHPKQVGKVAKRDRSTVIIMANKYKSWKEIYQKSC